MSTERSETSAGSDGGKNWIHVSHCAGFCVNDIVDPEDVFSCELIDEQLLSTYKSTVFHAGGLMPARFA